MHRCISTHNQRKQDIATQLHTTNACTMALCLVMLTIWWCKCVEVCQGLSQSCLLWMLLFMSHEYHGHRTGCMPDSFLETLFHLNLISYTSIWFYLQDFNASYMKSTDKNSTNWWFQPIWEICSWNCIISKRIGLKLRRAARTVTDAQLDVQDSRLPVDEWFGGMKYTGMYLFYYFGWFN